jgi:hypothetical protein
MEKLLHEELINNGLTDHDVNFKFNKYFIHKFGVELKKVKKSKQNLEDFLDEFKHYHDRKNCSYGSNNKTRKITRRIGTI